MNPVENDFFIATVMGTGSNVLNMYSNPHANTESIWVFYLLYVAMSVWSTQFHVDCYKVVVIGKAWSGRSINWSFFGDNMPFEETGTQWQKCDELQVDKTKREVKWMKEKVGKYPKLKNMVSVFHLNHHSPVCTWDFFRKNENIQTKKKRREDKDINYYF